MTRERVVGYVRVSSDDQAKSGFSLGQQKRNIERYAKTNNYKLVRIYEDGGKSGCSIDKRQGLNELLAYCADPRNKIKAVIIWKLDRISRSTADYTSKIEPFFKKHRIELLVIDGVNGTTNDVEMLRQMSIVYANYERNMGIERTKEGIRGKVALGQYPYHPPIGYKNVNKNGSRYKEMVIDEENVFWVKQIFSLCLQGDSIVTITNKLYQMGFRNKNGKKHPKSTINHILHNIAYTGKFYYEGKLIENTKYPPIITEMEFNAAQEKLRAPNKTRQTHTKFPYTECIKCSICGCQMTAERKKKVSRNGVRYYVYYHCTGNKGGNCKKDSYIREEIVEDTITQILSNITIPEDMIEDIMKELKVIHKKQGTDLEFCRNKIKSRINKIDECIKTIFESEVNVNSDGIKAILNNYEEERKLLCIEEEQLIHAAKQFYEESNLLLSFCSNAFDVFKKGSAEQKRKIVQILCSNFSYNGEKLVIELKPAFETIVQNSIDMKKLPRLDSNQQPLG